LELHEEDFMPYRLAQGERVAEGITRIALEEIESAITHLRKEDDSLRDQGIHEARKSIKRLRGIVRILMPGLGEPGKKDNIALRNTGRALSTLRDAAALIETVEGLSEQYASDPAVEQLAVVRSALRRRMEETVRTEDCRTVTGGAVAALKTLKRRVHKWQLPEGEFAVLAPGFERTYQRGRKALRRARASNHPDHLHDLRKRVKDHWYHVRLLDGALRRTATHAEKTLGLIQEQLGDDHNLTVLRDTIALAPASFGGKKVVPAVFELISRAQKELRTAALEAAGKIYSEKPDVYTHKANTAWSVWRSDISFSKPPVSGVAKQRTSAA